MDTTSTLGQQDEAWLTLLCYCSNIQSVPQIFPQHYRAALSPWILAYQTKQTDMVMVTTYFFDVIWVGLLFSDNWVLVWADRFPRLTNPGVQYNKEYNFQSTLKHINPACSNNRHAVLMYSCYSNLLHAWQSPAWLHAFCARDSGSPQHSWWGLVLAKMHPAQWVTLHNIFFFFFYREMWFIQCLCFLCSYSLQGLVVSHSSLVL